MRLPGDACEPRHSRRCPLAAGGAALILFLALGPSASAQDAPPEGVTTGYAGRPLAAVLQALQARGLRIVFTSNVVTADMRVRVEPRAATPRLQLDEILAPHKLIAREGPGGTLQVVRAPARREPASGRTGTSSETEETPANGPPLRLYNERVTVTSRSRWQPSGVGSEQTVANPDLQAMPGGLVDDPIHRIQSMPRVAPLGDYRSEFVVRASPYRHAEVVVDGVATPWLRHAPDGSASVSMFTSQLLESATLRAGAYARTYGDHLGPQLELTLREGSRHGVHVQGTVANTAATVVAEGPIGRARGSWLAAARQSLLEWPGEGLGSSSSVFGFSDAAGRLVLDVSARHQLGFTLLTGRSRVDEDEDADGAVESTAPANARTTVANLAWRSTIGSATVITHRAYVVRQRLAGNERSVGLAPSPGADEEVVYRATLVRRMRIGLLESAAQLGRTSWQRRGHSEAAAWTRSGYLQVRSHATDRLTIAPGIRVSGASHIAGPAVTPWVLGELAFGRRWTIAASTGVSHQFPELRGTHETSGPGRLEPERAVHVDVSVRQRLTANVRWEATIYQRHERGVLDGLQPAWRSGAAPGPVDSRLDGSARGFEIVVERRAPTGLSGWGAYTFGRARHSQAGGDATFWADFDQRHAVTAFGEYRLPDSTTVAATLRIGSGVPIPAYLSSRGEGLFAGDRRNDVRLAPYSRLDLRAARAFPLAGRRLGGFIEVVNVLNRSNVGASAGTFGAGGAAIGFTEPLSPRRLSAGVTLGF